MRTACPLVLLSTLLFATAASGQEAPPSSAAEAQSEDNPTTAQTERSPRRVVMLEVVFTETLDAALQARIGAELAEALRHRGLDVVEPSAVATALGPMGRSLPETCHGGVCVGWILEVLDGDVGLVAEVEGVENSYSIVLRLLGPYGDELVHAERQCDLCTFDELAESIAAVGGQAVSDIPHRVVGGRVAVFPSPASATVSVDGVELGVGALSIPLPIGEHTVQAALAGYRTSRQRVEVEPGAMSRVDLILVDGEDPAPAPAPTLRPLRRWLWAVVGTALGLTVGGGALLGVGLTNDDRSSGDPLALAGMALLGSGFLTALGAGIALRFVPPRSDSE